MDLFSPADQTLQGAFQKAVSARLADLEGLKARPEVSVDAGTGLVDGRSVIGALFWVHADTAGEAVEVGLRIAEDAFQESCRGEPVLYDVVVVPARAVTVPSAPGFPVRPD